MHCVKLLGPGLSARDFYRQVAEFQIRVAVLNGLTALGTPITDGRSISPSGERGSLAISRFVQQSPLTGPSRRLRPIHSGGPTSRFCRNCLTSALRGRFSASTWPPDANRDAHAGHGSLRSLGCVGLCVSKAPKAAPEPQHTQQKKSSPSHHQPLKVLAVSWRSRARAMLETAQYH
jgi:hypothetical protein